MTAVRTVCVRAEYLLLAVLAGNAAVLLISPRR
jgi:hypothetical protein